MTELPELGLRLRVRGRVPDVRGGRPLYRRGQDHTEEGDSQGVTVPHGETGVGLSTPWRNECRP